MELEGLWSCESFRALPNKPWQIIMYHPVPPALESWTPHPSCPGGMATPSLLLQHNESKEEALCLLCTMGQCAWAMWSKGIHLTAKLTSASGTVLWDEDPFLLLWFYLIFLSREMPQWQNHCRWHHKAPAGTSWVGTVRLSCSSLCLSFLFSLLCCANNISVTT